MDTSTIEKHQKYTRDEYLGEYYTFVIDTLKKAKIASMIDAGACTGEVTKMMFEKIPSLKESHLIEPMEENISFIENNLKDYNVKVYNKALVYGEETIPFGKLAHNVGGGSVFLQGDRVVKTMKLEELPIVDFLKMDIEGLEANIVKNSKNIQKIKFLEIEFHHYDEELQHQANRKPFVEKWLPNHKILRNGEGKESSMFLQLCE